MYLDCDEFYFYLKYGYQYKDIVEIMVVILYVIILLNFNIILVCCCIYFKIMICILF